MINILVIDDNAFMRKVLSKLIRTENKFNILAEADNSEAAVHLIQEHPEADVILIDISLEKEDSGLEIIQKIRQLGISTPILCVSLYEANLYSQKIREAGGQGYLMKQDAADFIFQAIEALHAGKSFWPQVS